VEAESSDKEFRWMLYPTAMLLASCYLLQAFSSIETLCDVIIIGPLVRVSLLFIRNNLVMLPLRLGGVTGTR
jgi:hypothetical protein